MVLYKIRDSSAFDEELMEKNEARVPAYNGRAFDWREQIPVRGLLLMAERTLSGALRWRFPDVYVNKTSAGVASGLGPLKCLQRVVILRGRAPLKPIQYSNWVTLGFIGILSRACATYFLQHRRPYLVFNVRKNLGFRIRQYRTNAKVSKIMSNFENRKPYQPTPLFSILLLCALVLRVGPTS